MTDYDPEEAIKRSLDQVVGTDYDPINSKAVLRRRLLKWTAGALCAVAAAALIVFIIESHRLPPKIPPRAAKPVVIQIVPSTPKAP